MKKYEFIVGGYVVANQFLRVKELPEVGVTAWATNDDYDKVFFGGPGLNIAYDLGRLGCRVLPVLSYVSSDKKEEIEALLASVNESPDALQPPVEGSSGVAIMIQDQQKNQLTIACRNSAGLQEQPFYPMEDRWFQEAEYAVLPIMTPQNVLEFLQRVRKNSVPLIFSMRADKKIFPREVLWDALTTAKIIFMNESEKKYIETMFDLDSITDLYGFGPAEIIVETLGKQGSVVYHLESDGTVSKTAVPTTECDHEAVDATGAGDAYLSGFLYGYLQGRPLAECAQYGSTLASFIIEKTGSLENAPTLEAMLERNSRRPDAVK